LAPTLDFTDRLQIVPQYFNENMKIRVSRFACHGICETSPRAKVVHTAVVPVWLLLVVALLSVTGWETRGQSVGLTPVQSGGFFGFQWTMPPSNVQYRVQSSLDLAQSNGWITEDLVAASLSDPARWMAPESMGNSKFYRLALPDPEIVDIEPAIVTAGSPVDVYLLGQNFGSNDILRLGSLILTNRVVISPTLMRVTFTPDTPGTYGFELDSAATGKTSSYTYSWTVVSQPAGSQALLEPPSLPPAAPKRLTIKQKAVENAVGEMRKYQKEPAHLEVPNLIAFSGELQSSAVDLAIPGRGLDFIFARTYRSRTGSATVLGNGWDFSYNLSIQPLGGDIVLHSGNGRDDTLFHQTNGTYVADGFFREGTLANNVFRLTFADSGYWEFNPLDASASAGKITRSVDRNGNTMAFQYDLSGRLTTIIDDLNRTNTIAYNSVGLLQSVTDFSGRTVSYTYYAGGTPGGLPGDLQSVTTPPVTNTPNGNDFPQGKTTTFTYTTGFSDDRLNHNLASITDPKGQSWLQIFYHTNTDATDLDFDAVDYAQRGPYRLKLRRYAQVAAPTNQFATVKAILNDGVGNVTECFFDSRNRCVRELDYTGRANPDLATTATANRPAGKLRPSDPDFFETRWAWNPDSLCTLETRPDGSSTQFVYERSFTQNASRSNRRLAGNLRVVHEHASSPVDVDGDGIPDVALRSTYFAYDPRFGAPASECRTRINQLESSLKNLGLLSRTGWDGTIKGRAFDDVAGARLRGWDGTIKGLGVTAADVDGDGLLDFAVSSIDPRGGLTIASYDSVGNCVRIRKRPELLFQAWDTEIAYNAFGQVTSITNAPDANGYRRVDSADYYTTGPQTGYCYTWTVDTQGPTTRMTFEHDSRGNVTRCIDPRGNDTLCDYNTLDQCVRFQNPTNLSARCVTDLFYDANDSFVQQTVEVRDQSDKQYSTKSDVWSFSVLNLCVSHAQQVSDTHFITNGFAYDGNDNLVLVSSPEALNGNDGANIIVCSYDERDLLFQATHGPNVSSASTTQYDYDSNGRCVTVTVQDAMGNTSPQAVRSYGYDGFGRCVSATDPMGNVSLCAYDLKDNLVYQRRDGEPNDLAGGALNRRLTECRYDYDSLNRCTRSHCSFFDIFTELPLSDGESTTSWAYAPNGQLSSVTDDNNHTTLYAYDSVGRLLSITDPKTNTVAYSYDASGNPLTASRSDSSDLGGAPQLFVATCTYDNLNRCVSAADNAGNQTRYAYDSLDRCVRSLDALGNLSGWAYDHLGRCTLAIADLNQDGVLDFTADAARTWTWDDNSRCVTTTDANTNTTSYAYDSLDRRIAVTNADGTTSRLIWSPRSNLIGQQNANGTVISNSFDLLDRCVRRDITPGAGVTATTTFELFAYDGCARLVLVSNDTSAASFGYDSLGDCVDSTQDGLRTTSSFDGVGNRLSLTYPSGRIVTCTFDALNQAATLNTAPSGGVLASNLAQYSYDGPGRLSRISRANGVNTRVAWDGLAGSKAPGDFGWQQVAGINHQVGGGGAIIDRRSFAYDQNQNKTLRAQLTPWIQGAPTRTNTFGYDALNRMSLAISANRGVTTRNDYTLDAVGNRLTVTNDGTASSYTRDTTTPEPADFQMDQYTLTPSSQQQYDRNGNLIGRKSSNGTTRYQYDYADRLVEVDSFSNGALGPVVSFTYDALGRRLGKTSYPPSPLAPITTYYVAGVDGTDTDCAAPVLEERSGGPAGPVSRLYCWGGNSTRLAEVDRDGFPDLVAFDGAGQAQYYHSDDLGNVLALTDAKGQVLEHYDYDDFGSPSFYSSDGVLLVDSGGLPLTASAQGNPFLFHGLFWDGETSLYCRSRNRMLGAQSNPMYRHNFFEAWPCRYMDPNTGRSTSRERCDDSSCREVGANAYTFAGDNPWSQGGNGDGGAGGVANRKGIVHRDLAARNTLLAVTFGRDKLKGSTKTQGDFNLANRFSLEIDGVLVAGVHTIDGLEHETVEYKDGEDGTMHTRPGNHKPGKMTVTKDWSNTSEWYNWRKMVLDGKVDRKSISVIFHNDAGEEAGRVNLFNSWPGGYKGPSLNAKSSGHATEKIEISYETMEWK
jgi:phage tail-like protein